MSETILTTKLNNGLTVLAAQTKYGVSAKTFANRTQAEAAKAKAQAAGIACWVRDAHRPFYVVIGE